eukprot:5949357-Amphidinium_carterae.1
MERISDKLGGQGRSARYVRQAVQIASLLAPSAKSCSTLYGLLIGCPTTCLLMRLVSLGWGRNPRPPPCHDAKAQ